MQLRIAIPKKILVDVEIRKVTLETDAGEICLLPKRLDLVAGLKPGILVYEPSEHGGEPVYVALDGGTLVKCGERVMVSSPNAVQARDLAAIEDDLDGFLAARNETNDRSKNTIEKMRADFVSRFVESEHYG